MNQGIVIALAMFALGAVGAYSWKEVRQPENVQASGTGRAPAFELLATDGHVMSLADLRGRVVVLTFLFTRCGDICPITINKFTWMQDELGDSFGEDVQFVMITVDPAYDTTEVLSQYAERIGADADGWNFLTGTKRQIETVTRSYGVYATSTDSGALEHILLTSLIDRDGVIAAQFLGERFAVEDMLGDLRAMVAGYEIHG